MGSVDFSVVVVLAALVGLLFVAIGYGQLVWLQRQAKARALNDEAPRSNLLSALFWLCLVASAICLLRAATSRGFPEQDATLAGDDLYAISIRQGLLAQYETRSTMVRSGDVLVRFTGRDGEEGQLALKSRKQILTTDLEIEKARPTEFDPELLRRLDQAKQLLQDRRSRQKQVLTERDSIEREATQQRLSVDNRKFRAEEDLRGADSELATLKPTLETAKTELESQEDLLRQGLLSKMEVARQRDKVTELEGQIAQREQRRSLLDRELKTIGSLDAAAEKTYSGQGAQRTHESSQIGTEISDADRAVAAAQLALEQDRPRAEAQRQKKLQQIEVQISECDALLTGNGRKAQVLAPFDGRVGFREPSPSSPPSDNGPLLVMYRPGRITATIHLEGQVDDADSGDLGADVIFSAEAAGRERTLGGSIVSKTLSRDEEEIVVACDPPDRVVRQLAMGGAVPVRVQLKRGVTNEASFRFGIVLGLIALALAGGRSLRRLFSPKPAAPPLSGPGSPGNPSGGTPPGGMPPFGDPRLDPSGQFASGSYAQQPGYAPPRESQPYLTGQPLPLALPSAARHTAPLSNPFSHVPGDDLTADENNPLYLRRLGMRLRQDVDATSLSPGIVRRVHAVIGRGGFPTAAQLLAGFGADVEHRQVARAVYELHIRTAGSAPPDGGLSQAVVSCAEFLQVMRAVGTDRLHGAIDAARSQLIAATLAAAESAGSSRETAGLLVKPLMEV